MANRAITRSMFSTVAAGALLLGTFAFASSATATDPPSGNATPSRTIDKISTPIVNDKKTTVGYGSVNVDAEGDIYALRGTTKNFYVGGDLSSWETTTAVVEFSKDFVPGTPKPLRVLSGNVGSYGVTSDGRLVTFASGVLREYPADWTYATRPTRTLVTGIDLDSVTMAVAPDGQVYVAGYPIPTVYPQLGEVLVYASDWSASSTPARTISGVNTELNAIGGFRLAVAPSGELIVYADGRQRLDMFNGTQDDGPRILRFAADADGDTAPVAIIAGASTTLGTSRSDITEVSSLAVSSSGEIYASRYVGDSPTLRVYASDASGDVAPIRTLNSGGTSVAVTSAGLVYMADVWGTINEYGGTYTPPPPPPATKQAPTAPRIIKVTEGPLSLTVDIRKSFAPGSSVIGRYVVTATSVGGSQDEGTCTIVLPAKPLACTIKGLDPELTYQVTANANSKDGTSPDSPGVKAKPQEVGPNDPLAISRVNTFDGGARVFFTAPNKSKRKAIGFSVKMYSTAWNGDRRGCVRNFANGVDPTQMWCDVKGVPGGTIVWFTVTPAYPKVGAGPTSPESKPTIVWASPGAVADAVFMTDWRGGITVRPTVPAVNGGKPVTGYRVVVQGTTQACKFEVKNAKDCKLTGFEPKVPVKFVIYAFNEIGEGAASRPFLVRPR